MHSTLPSHTPRPLPAYLYVHFFFYLTCHSRSRTNRMPPVQEANLRRLRCPSHKRNPALSRTQPGAHAVDRLGRSHHHQQLRLLRLLFRPLRVLRSTHADSNRPPGRANRQSPPGPLPPGPVGRDQRQQPPHARLRSRVLRRLDRGLARPGARDR